MITMRLARTRWVPGIAAAAAMAISGCGNGPPSGGGNSPVATKVQGSVRAGQQPVSGATVQLYAVGITGSRSAAKALIAQKVTTAADGSFDITGLWNCTNTAAYGSDPLLYLVATGGVAGSNVSASNTALAMMTALGRCSTVTPANFMYVNEVTTVASTYALAPFMGDYAHIGTTATGVAALANAFGTVTTLVDTTTGISPGSGAVAGVTVPVSEINTLANLIAACTGLTRAGACSALFQATMQSGNAAPTDTIGAMLQIARAPASSVATLYGLISATPFQPSLASAPVDWTMMVKYTGGGLSGPAGIAIDAGGNAWVANGSGSSVTEIGSAGTFLTGASGYSASGTIFGAQAVAVDRSGNIWIADTLLSTVVKLTVSGGAIQSSTTFKSAINGPTGLAIDSQNHVWVANFSDGTVTELTSNGVPMGGSPFKAGVLQSPYGIAIDSAGNAWVSDNAASLIVKFGPDQSLLSGAGFSDQAIFAPQGLAIDAQGRVWVAGNGNAGASLLKANGTGAASSPYQGGGLSQPAAVGIDGAGAAWVTNGVASGSVTMIPSTGSAPTGAFGTVAMPMSVAIDASGNLWTANSGDDSVAKFVGLATPAATPLAGSVGP